MQVITKKDNEQIKAIRKLKEKKYRDETRSYIIEGIKLVKEAINENAKIKMIVICEDCEETGESKASYHENKIDQSLLYEIAKYECIYVTKKLFSLLSEVQTPQGILAVVEKNDHNETINYTEDIIIVLDGIQDPGNLGTILRTIDSANLKQVILSSEVADPYNPKVVRSTMGAIFRINMIRSKNLVDTLKEIKKHKYEIVVTALDTNSSIYDIEYKKKVIIIRK